VSADRPRVGSDPARVGSNPVEVDSADPPGVGSGSAHPSTADGCAADGHQLDSSLRRLRCLLFEEGGLIRSLLADAPTGSAPTGSAASGSAASGPAQLAAAGPRVGARAADYELLMDTIYEGYLLHYRTPRVVRAAEQDLGLLAGDRLYALGLALLVKLGDIDAVAELADVITLTSLAHAGGNPELADAVWTAGARAVGWGPNPHHDRAKTLVRAGSPQALEAMLDLASH
jgi:hypothetical protein